MSAPVYWPENTEDEIPTWAAVIAATQNQNHRVSFYNAKKYYKNRNLRGMRVLYLNLSKFSFINCDLRGADFTGSDLREVDFSGSNLSEAVFVSTKEEGIVFNHKTTLPFSRAEAQQRKWTEK